MLEIEFRSIFNKDKYDKLKKFLDSNAENLGEDDKDCYYYIFSNKLVKLVNNISKKSCKISLKLNKIGEGAAFPEYELYFPQDQLDTAKKILDNLVVPDKIMHGPQKRTNYHYGECEIALKHSDVWGYHAEIEKVVNSPIEQGAAEEKIRLLARELGIVLMSDEDLKKFAKEAEGKINL